MASRVDLAADSYAWRLEVRLDQGRARHPGANASKLAGALATSVAEGVVVTHERDVVIIRAHTNNQVEDARRHLDVILSDLGGRALGTVKRRDRHADDWRITAGPYQAPRSRHRGRRRPDEHVVVIGRRTRLLALGVAGLAAAGGVGWYASSPGVASYQAGSLLILPLLIAVMIWLSRRLPVRLQWGAAILSAVVGPIVYLIVGGSQWWYWAQIAAWPFVALAITHSVVVMRQPGDPPPDPWYGGPMDGPWGPP